MENPKFKVGAAVLAVPKDKLAGAVAVGALTVVFDPKLKLGAALDVAPPELRFKQIFIQSQTTIN